MRLRDRNFDCIVPVPLHPARFRERGFNQAELLAKILGQRINLTLSRALERIRYTTTQTAFDRTERMENLRDAFRLRKKMDVRGLHVLLIDDVLTTGSTLSECARVLKEAGAISVYAAPRPAPEPWLFSKDLQLGGGGGRKRASDIPQGLLQKCPGCSEVVHEIELAAKPAGLSALRLPFRAIGQGANRKPPRSGKLRRTRCRLALRRYPQISGDGHLQGSAEEISGSDRTDRRGLERPRNDRRLQGGHCRHGFRFSRRHDGLSRRRTHHARDRVRHGQPRSPSSSSRPPAARGCTKACSA